MNIQIQQPLRNFDVRGIIESRDDVLKVVGLSNFNTTVFRITENLKTGEVDKEFFVETIRRNEEKFMFFYRLMKQMLLARKGQTQFEHLGAVFTFSEPDEAGIFVRRRSNMNKSISSYE